MRERGALRGRGGEGGQRREGGSPNLEKWDPCRVGPRKMKGWEPYTKKNGTPQGGVPKGGSPKFRASDSYL